MREICETDILTAQTAEQLFPEHRDMIGVLRGADPVFDEICFDFEEIAALAQRRGHTNAAVVECLTGLCDDIRSALEKRLNQP